ncbi:antibiotic biosynthesis monooxygenase [Carbonactinospora thermoautotrophica]|uniref:Antibiotic biosynthesis monooxygenase n=1 Tax=Carbonactinospora thermoautotrophica TaxID=1469144 RepID=A0A132N3Q6_9ACTN|nr:antibiotic biosynthesis monooxygenase family protein [Carbonactinospora thermoautotrophica]KWX04667.1 antibiotic biosynthesis monooxygenase [Carbonactinospora thermoautotrophica]KWX08153.1 antibiotic biosynthesis monooxygenase [Carbonactinospora thermoautotrophica]
MGHPVFRVELTMRIHPGKEAEFERTWLSIGEAVTSHPANLGQWLSRSADDVGTYVIVSDWVDEQRFREFERSERHRVHREMLHPLRASGSMTTMTVLYYLPGAASR